MIFEWTSLRGLHCKICSEHIEAIRLESARRGGTRGAAFKNLLSYVDGVDSAHKGNLVKHVKSGSLHAWAKAQGTVLRVICPDHEWLR